MLHSLLATLDIPTVILFLVATLGLRGISKGCKGLMIPLYTLVVLIVAEVIMKLSV